ncbi:MAG: hypothetical protein RR446_10830 [Lachnospiraceae bacterium]
MEKLFENRYVETRKTLSHFYKTCVFNLYRKIGYVIIALGALELSLLFLGMAGVINFSFNGKFRVLFFDMGAIILIFGIMVCCYHIIVARVAYRQLKKMNQGTIPETVITFGEQITVGKRSYDYRNVLRLVYTKEAYILMVGKMEGIVARKGCFTLGEEGDVAAFLKERCKNA